MPVNHVSPLTPKLYGNLAQGSENAIGINTGKACRAVSGIIGREPDEVGVIYCGGEGRECLRHYP